MTDEERLTETEESLRTELAGAEHRFRRAEDQRVASQLWAEEIGRQLAGECAKRQAAEQRLHATRNQLGEAQSELGAAYEHGEALVRELADALRDAADEQGLPAYQLEDTPEQWAARLGAAHRELAAAREEALVRLDYLQGTEAAMVGELRAIAAILGIDPGQGWKQLALQARIEIERRERKADSERDPATAAVVEVADRGRQLAEAIGADPATSWPELIKHVETIRDSDERPMHWLRLIALQLAVAPWLDRRPSTIGPLALERIGQLQHAASAQRIEHGLAEWNRLAERLGVEPGPEAADVCQVRLDQIEHLAGALLLAVTAAEHPTDRREILYDAEQVADTVDELAAYRERSRADRARAAARPAVQQETEGKRAVGMDCGIGGEGRTSTTETEPGGESGDISNAVADAWTEMVRIGGLIGQMAEAAERLVSEPRTLNGQAR